jgi:hypothetical protein
MRVVYSTMTGFNFGLVSAVHGFNRYPGLVVRAMRAIFAWAGTSFYDDFCTVEPASAGQSGQEMLRRLMLALGLPLADEKHVPMAPRFIFLGVQAALERFAPEGIEREIVLNSKRLSQRDTGGQYRTEAGSALV